MTSKQENILSVALKLFAEQGFTATPTSQIAKEANVSEGLIFRHFGNKDGLLIAILEQGQERVRTITDDILREKDPRKVIAHIIDLPIRLIEQEPEFWRLQFALKYSQTPVLSTKHDSDSIENLSKALYHAFDALGYDYPDKETEFLMIFLEGLSSVMLSTHRDLKSLIRFVKVKYDVVRVSDNSPAKKLM